MIGQNGELPTERPARRWGAVERWLMVGILILQAVILYRMIRTDRHSVPEPRRQVHTSQSARRATAAAAIPSSPQYASCDDFWHNTETDFLDTFGFLFGHPEHTRAHKASATVVLPDDMLGPQMDELLEQTMAGFEKMNSLMAFDDGWDLVMASPSMDMREQDDSYQLVFSLPSFDPSNIVVSLDGRVLTVLASSGERTPQGSAARSFERKILLPGPVGDGRQAQAILTNGILKVSLPKGREATPPSDKIRLL